MSRRKHIKSLETELRIIDKQLYVMGRSSVELHARHNKFFKRYAEIIRELESISIKWKIKKIMRRIFKHG